MARYIDADKLIEIFNVKITNVKKQANKRAYLHGFISALMFARGVVEVLPAADVVPKSEDCLLTNKELEAFSNQILTQRDMWMEKAEELKIELEAMRTSANSYKMHYEKAKQEVAREIFEEFDKIMHGYRVDKLLAELGVYIVEHGEPTLEQRLAELKKKYTKEGE